MENVQISSPTFNFPDDSPLTVSECVLVPTHIKQIHLSKAKRELLLDLIYLDDG